MSRTKISAVLFRAAFVLALGILSVTMPDDRAAAQSANQNSSQFSMQEIIDAGHGFFGNASSGFAKVVESAFQKYGLPNGYIIGQEGGGAFVAGVTYGEGELVTKNAGSYPLFWQGPSLGVDYGVNGDRVLMLVYDLPDVNSIYKRYAGVSGSAYVVAGAGMTVLRNGDVLVVPIHTGVGARLGINIRYLKMTAQPTWNPF